MATSRESLTRSLTVLGALTAIVALGSGGAAVGAQEAEATTAPAPSIGPLVQPDAPEILRGSVAPPPPAVEPAAGPGEPLIAAGDRVWFVDRERRRLTGCRLINTIYVDTQAIRCTERRLPRGAVVRD
jgi:hypothetical protein